jgi:hypothetical protein
MKSKKLIKTTKAIREIQVIDEVVVKCEGQKLCFPEAYFEMIEQCKLCKKWI